MTRGVVAIACASIACGPSVAARGSATTESSTSTGSSTSSEPATTTSSTGADTTTTATSTTAASEHTTTSSGDDTGFPPPTDGLGPWGYWPHLLDASGDWIVLADFDGDTHVDIFTQTSPFNGTAMLRTHLGNGDGTFESLTGTAIDWGVMPAAADFDDALGLDVISFPMSGDALVALADAAMQFPAAIASELDSGFPYFDAAVLDIDQDGLDDVAIAGTFVDGIPIYFSDGAGGLVLGDTLMESPCNFSSTAVGDFDGDGLDDVATTGNCDRTPDVLPLAIHRGTGESLALAQTFTAGPAPLDRGDVVAVDLDADGDLDLVTGASDGDGLVVVVNEGDTFATPDRRSTGWQRPARRILPAQLDLDTGVAFIVQDPDLETAVIGRVGDERLVATPIELVGDIVGVADLDEDGRTDLAVLADGELTIWASAG